MFWRSGRLQAARAHRRVELRSAVARREDLVLTGRTETETGPGPHRLSSLVDTPGELGKGLVPPERETCAGATPEKGLQ